jgi:hypothetical protein
MRKSHLTLGRACLGALAAGMLTAAFVVPGVALASSSCCDGQQCFTATVSAASTGAGATTTFTFLITNQSSRYPLNAATITAPAGIEITGASVASELGVSVAPGSGSTFPASSVTIGTPGPERGSAPSDALSLAAGASIPLTVTAILPCLDGSSSWSVTATNDGDNDRDDFQLNTSGSSLSSSVTGSCSLAFSAQPTQTAINDTISSVFNSSAPVQVEVLSDTSPAQVVTDSTAPVTVSIESNPATPPGTLSGTLTEAANDGVASFSDLSLNEAGDPYTLEAASPGITPATSAPFQISSSISPCPTSSCTAPPVANTTTTGSITSTSASAGDYLAVGLGGVSYSCGSYPLTSSVLSFDLLSDQGAPQTGAKFSGTLTISAAAVATSGHPAVWTWQLCYASTVPFNALPKTAGTTDIGGVTYYTGLLPYCSWFQAAPCVQYKYKDKAGDVVIAFLATGDPMGRG